MVNRYHDIEVEGSIHIPNDLTYANQTARLAASGLVTRHVGRLAKQTDDNSYWVLTSISPVTWAEFTGPAPAVGDIAKVLTVASDGAGGTKLAWDTSGGGTSGAVVYQAPWNASTNTPTLASGAGTKGYYYVVSVAGATNLDGITEWQINDWAF